MLLSFAQSGSARLSRLENRALHVVEDEAEFVRGLLRQYFEVGSVVRLKTAHDARRSLADPHEQDRETEQRPPSMSRGHLYWILSNPIYVGQLRPRDESTTAFIRRSSTRRHLIGSSKRDIRLV